MVAIERGFIQSEIQNSAYQHQRAIENQDEFVVGVNIYQMDEKVELEQLKVDPAIEATQRRRLNDLRQRRDSTKTNELLHHLETTARSTENLMPIFIECVENKITLGEICRVLRSVWGEYQPSITI